MNTNNSNTENTQIEDEDEYDDDNCELGYIAGYASAQAISE